jgi:DNA-binding IclR family transcriptional regulator
MGYVVENDGTYQLGLRFLTHGMAAKNSFPVEDIITNVLAAAVTELSMPTWWVVEEFGRGIFVDKRTPADETVIYGRVGKRSYLHAHAPGKAILAHLSEDYRNQILDYYGLPAYTHETITDEEKLAAELERVRERGYAVDDGEVALGIKSVGTAFEGPHDYTHALGVFGYSHDFTESGHNREVPTVLRETVQTIEESIGGDFS